ncbi:MAG: dipeptidase [Acidobacteriia bacterium]|nr:dipeptidase [Terriglobia bacterium]
MTPEHAVTYARRHRHRFLAELKDFVRFPSVSSQPKYARDLKNCAIWLGNHLRRIGLERVKVIPTRGHPIVYGTWLQAYNRPILLVYGHYDVLPADPLDQWRTPPFTPTVKGDNLYGRGACDDKGQLFTHLKAIESYLRTGRSLPINVKCLFEGEEEIDSPNLMSFIARNRNALRANVAVVSDSPMLGPNQPAISYAGRGALRLELEVRGPGQDLHSGNFGGAIHNPLQSLCEIIGSLHDENGHISIPGFYDDVRDWSENERAFMARTGPRDAQILSAAHAEKGWGEDGFTLYERLTIRPALTVNGIVGGYQGAGVKAVIPSHALAKLSFRLVPDQDPKRVERLFRNHIADIVPPTVTCAVRVLSGAKPAVLDREHPAVRAAVFALRKGFGSSTALVRSGGSFPVLSMFQQLLGIPTVMMGFALPDDPIHSPNEKFHLGNFYRGIETSIWFLAAAAERLKRARQLDKQTVWSSRNGN